MNPHAQGVTDAMVEAAYDVFAGKMLMYDEDRDLIARMIGAALAAKGANGQAAPLHDKVEQIRTRVERTMGQTFSSDVGDIGEQGRIAREDFDILVISALANPVQPPWRDMASAPKDGTHILAVLHREACEDMDGIRREPFSEIREIFFQPYTQLDMFLPWHAGDPFDSHEGLAPEHMGEAVPVAWLPVPALPIVKPARHQTGTT